MCRLFGFKSVLVTSSHRSLVAANNALLEQSLRNPDGWGLSYYIENYPHVVKSIEAAHGNSIFAHVSEIVKSKCFLAHIRKATMGKKNILNTHPFQYKNWCFIHNGHIFNLKDIKKKLLENISPNFKGVILGDTDSELLFYYFLTKIINIETMNETLDILAESISSLEKLTGNFKKATNCSQAEEELEKDNKKSSVSFILTNGEKMIGFEGGKKVYFSTHKDQCPENKTCDFYNNSCEAKTNNGGKINHLIISSEKIIKENIWQKLSHKSFVAIDKNYNLYNK